MNKLKVGILITLLVSAFSLGKSVFTEGSKNSNLSSLLINAHDHDETEDLSTEEEYRQSEAFLGGD